MSEHAGSILVVDDEPAIRESLEFLLSEANYRVALAEGGLDGLKKVESDLFDLVLLDVMMPDKNGLEVLEEIGRSSPETAVIMITASAPLKTRCEPSSPERWTMSPSPGITKSFCWISETGFNSASFSMRTGS